MWKTPPYLEVNIFYGLLSLVKLLLMCTLLQKGLDVGKTCKRCDVEAEDLKHLVFVCPIRKAISHHFGISWPYAYDVGFLINDGCFNYCKFHVKRYLLQCPHPYLFSRNLVCLE